METLPAETLAQIFELLTPLDILNLPFNISVQGLSLAQGRLRFRRFKVWMGKAALNSLVRMSNHPLISQCTEELLFEKPNNYSLFCDTSREWWNKELRPTSKERKNGVVRRKASKSTAHQKLQIRPLDVTQLGHALKHLSGLRSLDIYTKAAVIKVGFGKAVASSRYSSYIHCLGDCCDRTYNHEGLGWGDYEPKENAVVRFEERLTKTVLHGLSAGNLTPSKVLFHDLAEDIAVYEGHIATAFDQWLENVPEKANSMLCSRLKRLELFDIYFDPHIEACEDFKKLPGGRWPTNIPLRGPIKTMQAMCSSAALLEKVTISCKSPYHLSEATRRPVVPLRTLFGSNLVHHLAVLTLVGIKIQETELSDFLGCCAATLRFLQLDHVHVFRGTWLSLFESLKGLFAVENITPKPIEFSGSASKPRNQKKVRKERGLQLVVLEESGPEVSELIGYKQPITLEAFGSWNDPVSITHVLDWLCGKGDLNPYWREKTGAPRFEPFGDSPWLPDGFKPLYAPGYYNPHRNDSVSKASEELVG